MDSQETPSPAPYVSPTPPKDDANIVGITLGLIFLPVFGVIRMWFVAKWKLYVKIVISIIAFLALPFQAVFIVGYGIMFLLADGNIQAFLPQDPAALAYLHNRYHENFVITKSNTGGAGLGSSITYSAQVHPASDSSLLFTVSRCITRCDIAHTTTKLSDTYPSAIWSKEQTQRVTYLTASNSSKGKYNVNVNTNDTNVVDNSSGKVISFESLSPQIKKTIAYSIYYTEENGTYTSQNKAQRADDILQLADYLNKTDTRSTTLTYDIYAQTPPESVLKNRDQYHFTSSAPSSLHTREDVYKAFTLYASRPQPKVITAPPSQKSPSQCQISSRSNAKTSVEISGESKTIENYLTTKYGGSFRVRDCYSIIAPNYADSPNSLENYAIIGYPAANSRLNFGITKIIDSKGAVSYSDTYLATKWTEEATPEVQKLLSSNYLIAPRYTLIVTPSQKIIDNIHGMTPAFTEVKSSIGKDVTYDLSVYNYPNDAIPISNDEHVAHIVTIAKFLTRNYPQSNLTYKTDSGICTLTASQLALVRSVTSVQGCIK